MALTTKITKKSVMKAMDGMWNIMLTLDLLDKDIIVSSREFSISYKQKHDLDVVIMALKGEIQKAVDDYMMEQKLFADANLDAAIATLSSSIVVKEA